MTAPEDISVADKRRTERLAALPAAYKSNPERLACELALGLEEPTIIFARYGHTTEQAVALLQDSGFAKLLDKVAKEVREGGLRFRAKARAMAEDLLPEAYNLATDEEASSSVRADLIQWFARIADLEPAPKPKDGAGGGTGGFSLQIVFAGESQPKTVLGREPVTIEG